VAPPAYLNQQRPPQHTLQQHLQFPPPPQQPLPVPSITTTNTEPAPKRLDNGILQVRITGAKNLRLPDSAVPHIQLPYAVIEFDRNEFAAEATGQLQYSSITSGVS
jgi:hypothetical protein